MNRKQILDEIETWSLDDIKTLWKWAYLVWARRAIRAILRGNLRLRKGE